MKKHLITALLLTATMSFLGCERSEPSKPAEVKKAAPAPAANAVVKKVSTSTARAGKVIYDLHCAGCHAAGLGHAATMKLELARAAGMSVLVQRTDLSSQYIHHIVRDGLLEMPPFRPTDINDEELENLAQYMIEQGKVNQQDTKP